MKKALKELIESAQYKQIGEYTALMIISNGPYDGVFGRNGYNNILVLGNDKSDKKWYRISEHIDAIHIQDIGDNSLNVEIPSEYGVPVIWLRTPIHISDQGTSSMFGKVCEV